MPTDRHRNFRLRGIPRKYESRAEVRELVKNILSIKPGASVTVHSLAIDPIQHNGKVATLSFGVLPDCLSDGSINQWVFTLLVNEASDENGFNLVFDTHFSGFTPLQHTKDDDCYVE
jgi:hypothetical protein